MNGASKLERDIEEALGTMTREPSQGLPAALGAVHGRTRRLRRRRAIAAGVLGGVVVAASAAGALGLVGSLADLTNDNAPIAADNGAAAVAAMPLAPLSPRTEQAQAATDTGLFVWGGRVAGSTSTPGAAGQAAADGAVHDWRTGRWMKLPGAPLSPRWGAVAIPAGEEVLVVGGRDGEAAAADGAVYDLGDRRWTPLSAPAGCYLASNEDGRTAAVTEAFALLADRCGSSQTVVVYSIETGRWARVDSPVGQVVDVAGTANHFAVLGENGRLALYDASRGTWEPHEVAEAGSETLSRHVAVGSDRQLPAVFLVEGASTPGGDRTRVLELADGTWTTLQETAGAPSSTGPWPTTVDAETLVWGTDSGICAFTRGAADISCASSPDGDRALARAGTAFVPLGNGSAALWGGEALPPGGSGQADATSSGVVVRVG